MDSKEPATQPPSSGISGDVKSVDGIVLSNARICCNEVETRTLADGTFAITSLAPGTYDITVILQGHESITKSVSIQEGNVAELSFCLPKSIGTGRIFGHVYDSESKEIVQKGGTIVLVKPIVNEYGQIGQDGHFEFKNLPSGTYKILPSISGYIANCVTLEVTDGEMKKHDFILKSLDIEEPPWG